MRLKLPLHKYDEAGRVKPPWLLFVCLCFLARGIVVFIASLSFRQDGGLLLSIFYPVKSQFYLSLFTAIPAILTLFFLGFRERIWKAQLGMCYLSLPIVLAYLLISDLLIQLYILRAQHFAFAWPTALTLCCVLLLGWYLVTSKHMRIMLADWRLNS
ncbi:DUF2919 domain-containing protein [Glaciecola sp.]|jgi:hypothetical protein|uniref:DUF2919 domain-containing protein n=1 Tax=Glaciecola sp. MF2-115 TaxID=3384827 RepID=UPI003988B68B